MKKLRDLTWSNMTSVAMTSKYVMTRAGLLLLYGAFGCSVAAEPDLASWSQVGDLELQIDGNGAAAGPHEDSAFLVSTEQYGDMKMSVEFLIEADTNSGIYIRCSDPAAINPDNCYEINIWDNHPNQDNRTGSIVRLAKPLAHVDTVGEWSVMEIEAVGDLIVVQVNGVETARFSNDRSASGHVALQFGAGGSLQFRNVKVEAL
jgi:hypothetical protein